MKFFMWHVEKRVHLKPIKMPVNKSPFDDARIGVIDTETYETYEGKRRIYSLGFFSNLDSEPTTYYIDEVIIVTTLFYK